MLRVGVLLGKVWRGHTSRPIASIVFSMWRVHQQVPALVAMIRLGTLVVYGHAMPLNKRLNPTIGEHPANFRRVVDVIMKNDTLTCICLF